MEEKKKKEIVDKCSFCGKIKVIYKIGIVQDYFLVCKECWKDMQDLYRGSE
jgi:hypothetical protein